MSQEARRHARPGRSRRIRRALLVLGVVVLLLATTVVAAYFKLQGNINGLDVTSALGNDRPEAVDVRGPQQPLNVLVMGSDTREGLNGKDIGGDTPGLSDTTILLHLSADRKRAYGVSLPRDAMVMRPECENKSATSTVPGGLTMFNAAYAVGGPACTIKTVEQLTHVRIDHFIVIDFVGFKSMVNALHGVRICVPQAVDDQIGHIQLPAGSYTVNGEQALNYVRVRHDIGAPTGDIGRMKRQQAFISAMINKVMSAGTLANPARLYRFLDAATQSLTTDQDFANLRELASLGSSLKDIGLDNIAFVTVPFQPYPADPNRLEWAPNAAGLWVRIRHDEPLGPFGGGALTAAQDSRGKSSSGASPSPTPSGTPSGSPSGSASPSTPAAPSPEQVRAEREAAGLCT